MAERSYRPLVLGVGNILMSDEGVGIHAVRVLEKEALPQGVTVLDGGTGGFHLLSLFEDFDPIIMIDASLDSDPEGTVRVRFPRFASDFPRSLSAHDIGLRDLLESASLLGPLPRLALVTVSVKSFQTMRDSLSKTVERSIPQVLAEVRNLFGKDNVEVITKVLDGSRLNGNFWTFYGGLSNVE